MLFQVNAHVVTLAHHTQKNSHMT